MGEEEGPIMRGTLPTFEALSLIRLTIPQNVAISLFLVCFDTDHHHLSATIWVLILLHP